MSDNELTRRIDRLEVLMSEAVDAKNQAAEAKNDTLRADVNAAFAGLRVDMIREIARTKVDLMIWIAMMVGLGVAVLGLTLRLLLR